MRHRGDIIELDAAMTLTLTLTLIGGDIIELDAAMTLTLTLTLIGGDIIELDAAMTIANHPGLTSNPNPNPNPSPNPNPNPKHPGLTSETAKAKARSLYDRLAKDALWLIPRFRYFISSTASVVEHGKGVQQAVDQGLARYKSDIESENVFQEARRP